jgi:hypothetical protein
LQTSAKAAPSFSTRLEVLFLFYKIRNVVSIEIMLVERDERRESNKEAFLTGKSFGFFFAFV